MSAASPAPPGDKATVTVHVAVPPDVAFAVFTEETDLWWKRGPRYRFAGKRPGVIHFEPVVGGRLFEAFDGAAAAVEMGRVTAWDPPRHLAFTWRLTNFAPDEVTFVDVRFEATASGTRVTVEHRGWGALRADHPARHGDQGAAFSRRIGMWWSDLVTSFRLRAEAANAGPPGAPAA